MRSRGKVWSHVVLFPFQGQQGWVRKVVLVLLCLLLTVPAGTAFASETGQAAGGQIPMLTVSGTGTVTVAPDQAVVNLTVVTMAATAQAAQEENARHTNAAIEALLKVGLARESIQTSGYSIWPEYNYNEKREKPEIIGYRAHNQMHVKVDDLGLVGKVIDTAIQAGVNQVESVFFVRKDFSEAAREALFKACLEARAKAETIARALGVSLGAVMSVNESQSWGEPPVYRYAVLEGAGGPGETPIQPGEIKMTSTVTISFALRQ